MINRWK